MSVSERKKNSHIFSEYYSYLCQLRNTNPPPSVKVERPNHSLEIIADRIKFEDWRTLLNALSLDRSLHMVTVYSKQKPRNVLEHADTEAKAHSENKVPALYTRFILMCLAEALSLCLSNSTHLTCLRLDNIPLTSDFITVFVKGLERCKALQHLSFTRTSLGDNSCLTVCRTLRSRSSLLTLNLANCKITAKGAEFIADLIKLQKLARYGESWKHTLRYRKVDPDIMPGLRRVTLSHNPLKDDGLQHLIDVLIDDVWIKALDIQNCDLTTAGAEAALQLVKTNTYINVVDLRGNNKVEQRLVEEIMLTLAQNSVSSGVSPDYTWMSEETSSICSGSRPVSNNFSTRTYSMASMPRIANTRRSEVRPLGGKKCAVPVQLCNKQRQNELTRKKSTNATNYNNMDSDLQKTKSQLSVVTQQLELERQLREEAEQEMARLEQKLSGEAICKLSADPNGVLVGKEMLAAVTTIFHQFCSTLQPPCSNEEAAFREVSFCSNMDVTKEHLPSQQSDTSTSRWCHTHPPPQDLSHSNAAIKSGDAVLKQRNVSNCSSQHILQDRVESTTRHLTKPQQIFEKLLSSKNAVCSQSTDRLGEAMGDGHHCDMDTSSYEHSARSFHSMISGLNGFAGQSVKGAQLPTHLQHSASQSTHTLLPQPEEPIARGTCALRTNQPLNTHLSRPQQIFEELLSSRN